MLKVVIGSLVLCHLLPVVNKDEKSNNPNPPLYKVLGEVVDIEKSSRYIENVEKKEAVRVSRDLLIVKGINKTGMFQIDSQACMIVRDENESDRKKKVVEEKDQAEIEAVEDLPAEVKAPPPLKSKPKVIPKKKEEVSVPAESEEKSDGKEVNKSLVDFLK